MEKSTLPDDGQKPAIRIRNMRVAAGLNQTQVAAAAGMTRQEYAMVDAGKIEASEATYTRIRNAILALARKRAQSAEEIARTA